MKKIFALTIVVASLSFSSCYVPYYSDVYDRPGLGGRVVDAASGVPINDVRVSVRNPRFSDTMTAITDESGAFTLPALTRSVSWYSPTSDQPSYSIDVQFSKTGYKLTTITLNTQGYQTVDAKHDFGVVRLSK